MASAPPPLSLFTVSVFHNTPVARTPSHPSQHPLNGPPPRTSIPHVRLVSSHRGTRFPILSSVHHGCAHPWLCCSSSTATYAGLWAMPQELSNVFSALQHLMHGWLFSWSRWFIRHQREALSTPSSVVVAADQSYLFVVLLVDNIMHSMQHPRADAAEWRMHSPTLLALRQVSHGGRQAVEEDGPANGHMTARATCVGAIGRHLQLHRIFERAGSSQQTRRW